MHPDDDNQGSLRDYGLWQTNHYKNYTEVANFAETYEGHFLNEYGDPGNPRDRFAGVDIPKDANPLGYLNGLLNENEAQQRALAEIVKQMPVSDWEKRRETLWKQSRSLEERRVILHQAMARAIEAQRREEAAQLACAWCGKLCANVDERDEHEDECGL